MIAEELHQEALQQANSREGMSQLIHALLTFEEHKISQLEMLYANALGRYVLLHRCRAIHRSHLNNHNVELPRYLIRFPTGQEIDIAHDNAKFFEECLVKESGSDYVMSRKKYWGRIFSFRFLRKTEGNVYPETGVIYDQGSWKIIPRPKESEGVVIRSAHHTYSYDPSNPTGQ